MHPNPRPLRAAIAAALVVLQALLGAAVVVADGRPASGHLPVVAGELEAAPASASGPVHWLDGRHDCPFCDYLAGHQTTAPQRPAVTLPAIWTYAGTPPAGAQPLLVVRPRRPPSRAPPVA